MSSLPITQITTDNPQKEIWRYLRLFTHEAYVEDFIDDENAKEQVISCLKQAEEIYSISKSASMLTKPILYYTGMQRLAKSLIFLKNPTVNQNDLNHHGLTGGGISSDIENFLGSKIHVAEKGIFKEFSKLTTKNRVLLKKTVYKKGDYHHDERWVIDCEITEFLKSREFKVGDLFKLIPEILALLDYLEVKNDLLIPCHFSVREHPDGRIDSLTSIPKKLDLETLKRKFPELNEYKVAGDDPYTLILTGESKDNLLFPKRVVQAETGELFLINADNDDLLVTDFNVHFLLMFLLSFIARYKSPLLREILEGNKKSENVALIEKFIETSETKFPKLILDEISGKYFVFEP
jgi:hypothetical protein